MSDLNLYNTNRIYNRNRTYNEEMLIKTKQEESIGSVSTI